MADIFFGERRKTGRIQIKKIGLLERLGLKIG